MITLDCKPCMTDTFAKIFSWFFMFTVVVSVGIGMKWAFLDQDPLTLNYVHSQLLTEKVESRMQIRPEMNVVEVRRGKLYWRWVEYCVDKHVSGLVIQKYVDGITFGLPAIPNSGRPGCRGSAFAVTIPTTLPLGEYRLETLVRYRLNPFRVVDSQKQVITLAVVE